MRPFPREGVFALATVVLQGPAVEPGLSEQAAPFYRGDRVWTPQGWGTVTWRDCDGYCVLLDSKVTECGYSGSVFPIEDVKRAMPRGPAARG